MSIEKTEELLIELSELQSQYSKNSDLLGFHYTELPKEQINKMEIEMPLIKERINKIKEELQNIKIH